MTGFGIGNDETNTFPFVIEHGAANNVLYLDAAERVGINTASPSVELHVQSGSPEIRLDDVGEGQVDLGVSHDTFFFEGNAGQNIIQIDTTANAAAMGIADNGWVGFGTFNPGTEVEIASANSELRLDDTTFGEGQVDLFMAGHTFRIDGDNGQAIVKIDTTSPMSLGIDASGNIGIGTDQPSADLHVFTPTPTIRLDDANSPRRWDVELASTNRLEFTDLQTGRTPFRIEAAPANTLVIDNIVNQPGRVGVNTGTPATALDVNGTAAVDRLGAGTRNPSAALDVSGVLNVRQGTRPDDFKVRRWASRMADVDALLPGSRFGVLIEGSRSGHTVVGLRENGLSDTFSIIGGGGDWNSDATYDTLLLSLDGRGNLEIDGALTENSDATSKARFSALDPAVVLGGVVSLNVSEWEYRDTPGVRHVGPTAQDFHEAFGLGASPTGISTLDTSGVALVSIQALADLVDQQAALLQLQSELIADLQAQMAELQAGINARALPPEDVWLA